MGLADRDIIERVFERKKENGLGTGMSDSYSCCDKREK